ncbi:MAG: hypothetical protein LBS37_06170 [Treponema sp.]|jgi:hypothetical protein|nr:hypothetical protein [Treponema sp.]
MYKTPARRLFPALCALLLAFAACKNPIISEWYREDDDKNQNQSSASAPQTPQSAALQRVNDLALTYNVPAPYGGETPVRSFAGPQYEGRVDWSVSGGGAHNGPFVTGTAYTALVNIVAAAGWTFDGVAENSFAHLGGAGAAVRNAAGEGTALLVIIEFAPA